MISVLSDLGLPTMVALTKIDKLKSRERETVFKRVAEPLGLGEDQVVLTSSKSGEGADVILEAMAELLEADPDEGGEAESTEVEPVEVVETQSTEGGTVEAGEAES